ncbi:recombinase family protein [Clostridium perfringens]|nr:recombinase family protein [Clostridium perfringens]
MNIAYLRVSSVTQNLTRQEEDMKNYNIEKFFIEKASAKDRNRPQLQAMLEFCRENDVIYVKDFSRVARNTKDLLYILDYLKLKKVRLISLKEDFDTNDATGQLMVTMIGAINEFYRNIQREHQLEGIAIAKREGRYKGRKAIEYPSNWEEVYNLILTKKINSKEAMEKLNLKSTTFYKLKKKYEDKIFNERE